MTNTQNDVLRVTTESQKSGFDLAPLFTWQGRNVYPIFGAEGEEGGEGEPNGESDDDDTTETGEDGEDGGTGQVSREDFDKLRRQLSAADKGRSAAEKRLKEIDDANKDELTKATERAEELTKQNAKQAEEIAGLRLQNAFLSADTKITWHDPADALALAERQGYLAEVIGEDGKVDTGKLKTKLTELAKAKPHLVKDDGGRKEETPKAPTGQKIGSKVNGKTGDDKVPSRYDKYLNR
jgi:hypothetical protein